MRALVPTPVLLLAAGAAAEQWLPGLDRPSEHTTELLVSAALVLILFEGGLQIGVRRIRPVVGPVLALGVLGTFATVAGIAAAAHALLDVSWFHAVLVGTALAPTDPAVVFAVLGRDGAAGRAGTVLQGESGANDPVGISLMSALLGAGALSAHAAGEAAGTFALQLLIGSAAGIAGAALLRRVPVPPLLGAAVLFALTTVAHGSGFLAVFLAGTLLADHEPPHAALHARLAGLGEVLAFLVLGLTVELDLLVQPGVLLPGLALAALLVVVVRPVLGWPLLRGAGLSHRQEAFVLAGGLKGAVPLLLGSMLVPEAGGARLYALVVVVVLVSVLVQGPLTPYLARRWRLAG